LRLSILSTTWRDVTLCIGHYLVARSRLRPLHACIIQGGNKPELAEQTVGLQFTMDVGDVCGQCSYTTHHTSARCDKRDWTIKRDTETTSESSQQRVYRCCSCYATAAIVVAPAAAALLLLQLQQFAAFNE